MNNNKKLIAVIFCSFALSLFSTTPAKADAACVGWAIGESFVPGLGYLPNGNYGVGLSWMAIRYASLINSISLSEKADEFGEPLNEIREYERGDKDVIEEDLYKYRTRANTFGLTYVIGGFISLWDLIKHDCETEYKSLTMPFAPFAINRWYNNAMVLGPIGLQLAILSQSGGSEEDRDQIQIKNLYGISADEAFLSDLYSAYLAGVWEEMIYRDLIQAGLYRWLNNSLNWQKNTSWHTAVFSAAAIFGLGHQGIGNQAGALAATLIGIYLGYVYQPSPDVFRLHAAIATHSWWNSILTTTIDRNTTYFKKEAVDNRDLLRQVPIIAVNFQF